MSSATPKLTKLFQRHGFLGDRLVQLRKPQQEEIANAAFEEGYVNALQVLEVSAPHMAKVMQEAGYGQCGGCEEWFPKLELEEVEDSEFLEVGANPERCEECKLAADTEWAAPPPPVPTTPEEIAAAEEKRNKAREAVIRQAQRAEERKAILAEYEEPNAD